MKIMSLKHNNKRQMREVEEQSFMEGGYDENLHLDTSDRNLQQLDTSLNC